MFQRHSGEAKSVKYCNQRCSQGTLAVWEKWQHKSWMERAEDMTGTLRVATVWALKRLTEQRMQQPEGVRPEEHLTFVPKTISRKRRNKAGAGSRNLTMATRGRVKALKALSPSHETACSGISTHQPEPGRIPNIFSLLCQVRVTLNLWAQKEFSGYRETAAIHHISPPLTDWESIIIKHPSALAITVNHLEGESIHTGPLHTSLVLSLESEPPDANYSYSRIGVTDSPARFGIPVEIHINMEFIQQLVPVTANDETSA